MLMLNIAFELYRIESNSSDTELLLEASNVHFRNCTSCYFLLLIDPIDFIQQDVERNENIFSLFCSMLKQEIAMWILLRIDLHIKKWQQTKMRQRMEREEKEKRSGELFEHSIKCI